MWVGRRTGAAMVLPALLLAPLLASPLLAPPTWSAEPVGEPVSEPVSEPVGEPAREPVGGRVPGLAVGPDVRFAAPAPQARTLCTVTDPRIAEASGLTATADRLHLVNDGGSAVEVFELDRRCRVTRVLRAAVNPYDVEDLARTSDGALWLSDTGDNDRDRQTVALERLDPSSGAVRLYRLTYPDGAHDAEALLVDRTGRPYVVTKEPLGGSDVYTPEGDLSTDRPSPLRKVATVRFGLTGTDGGPVGAASQTLVTGGAVSADGRRIALRTYTDLYLWSAPDGDIEAALRDGERTRVPLPAEEQGEAVAFDPDGRSVLTVSEGSRPQIHVVAVPAAQAADESPPATASAPPGPTSPAGGAGDSGDDSDGDGNSSGLGTGAAVVLAALLAFAVIGLARKRG